MDFKHQIFERNLVVPPPHITEFPVEIMPSKGRGVGGFATRNVARGTVMCFYDAVVVPYAIAAPLISGKAGYTQLIGDGLVAAGFPEHLRNGGCGQLINDALTEYADNDLKYLKHINVKLDCVELDDGRYSMVFVSTKRIKKGNELLHQYGQGYWETRRLRSTLCNEWTEENYASKLMQLILDRASCGAEDKIIALRLYEQALDKTGMDGYRLRYKIAQHMGELIQSFEFC